MIPLRAEILLLKTKPILVGTCYRVQENREFLQCFENTLRKLNPEHYTIILDDFNICLLKDTSSLRHKYENLLNLFNFKQLIKSPTCVTLTSSSLIDHISENCSE